MKHRVVFVCTGNTCRSPMAEMIFAHRVAEKQVALGRAIPLTAQSAGIDAVEGRAAAEAALRTLAGEGIPTYDHRSTPFGDDHAQAQVVLTMTEHHKAALLARFPELEGRIATLNEFAALGPDDIADPYMQGDNAYLAAFWEIDRAVTRVIGKLLDDPFFDESGSEPSALGSASAKGKHERRDTGGRIVVDDGRQRNGGVPD